MCHVACASEQMKGCLDLRHVVIAMGSIDFICTLIFSVNVFSYHDDVGGRIWCIVMLIVNVCLVFGAIYNKYICVALWQTIMMMNIVFLIMLCPIIPMMIVGICLGDHAIEHCYQNQQSSTMENFQNDGSKWGNSSAWIFQYKEGIHLNCDEAHIFFNGLKYLMVGFMAVIVMLPTYYITCWIVVNRFRNKCLLAQS